MKRKFKIIDMHCTSCALTIDMDLEEVEGVMTVKTSYAKGETEVEFDQEKVTEEAIIKTIQKTGYNAEFSKPPNE